MLTGIERAQPSQPFFNSVMVVETVVAIALSVISLGAASNVQWRNPALAAALRMVPIVACLAWCCRRFFSSGDCGEGGDWIQGDYYPSNSRSTLFQQSIFVDGDSSRGSSRRYWGSEEPVIYPAASKSSSRHSASTSPGPKHIYTNAPRLVDQSTGFFVDSPKIYPAASLLPPSMTQTSTRPGPRDLYTSNPSQVTSSFPTTLSSAPTFPSISAPTPVHTSSPTIFPAAGPTGGGSGPRNTYF